MATISELAADGVQWLVKCKRCGREVRLMPEQLAAIFEPETTEAEARGRLKCKRCFTRGENYLSATPGRSYAPGRGLGMGGAYVGIYGKR